MITCNTHQSRLLHHLYGLLDDAEHQSLTAHLATCETCRAALDKARSQQQLLAAAAKTSFPDVRFEPATLPMQRAPLKPKPQRPWRRWAIAATIFLAIAGPLGYTAIAWLVHTNAVSRAQSDLAKATRERDQLLSKQTAEQQTLNAEIAALNKQIELVELQYRNDLIKIKKEYDSQPVQFTVTHPKTLQAGGVNELKIEAKRKPGLASDAKLLAMVVDSKTNAEITRTSLKEGTTDFVLPANLPLKPGTQLSLRLLAVQPDGKEEKTLVNEILPLVTSLYVTHIMTDRPMYRPGELVHFRSLTLERFSLQPAEEVFELRYRLVRMVGDQEQVVEVRQPGTQQPAQMIGASKLKDKDGKALLGPDGKELRGIGAGTFQLPDELPGGEYSLIVSEAYDRFPPEKRKVLVNRYQAPRLLKDVDFTRKSYGPGDLVTVTCKVALAEGGRILSGQPVKLVAEVDKLECAKLENLKTDDKGQCVAQFRLPQKIERGEGVLTVTFTDGANVETTVEPINIILNKLVVDFFPEGGELIAGAPNRVYFQVRTPLGKPAELRGKIVNKAGQPVTTIQTVNDHKEIGVNQGMGLFDFTPVKGEHYELKIDSPGGIEGSFWLPPVQDTGVVLHLPQGVVTNKIDVVLHSIGKDRKLLVGAYCRGQLLDHESATVGAGQSKSLTLKPAASVSGVYRITVFEVISDNELKPLAERLIYRHSPDKLNLQLFTDKNSYTPGDRVTLSLKATDQHNKPAPAIVVVSVVDKSILKLRNDRTARAMPSHFLLTSEVRGPEDLEYADFLLLNQSKSDMGLDVAKAHVALDLLLGTQGWRRFIEQKSPGQQEKGLPAMFKDDAKRFAKGNGQSPEQMVHDTSEG
ncbi:MAG TPA: hypothetical protein VE988_25810, partial [Gemmataceae bacterium]|nr:hypothetical protein [Gemmataceae bacterium]